MKSPRHRWNCVAMKTGRPHQKDGLYSMTTPDKIATDLIRTIEGKSKSPTYQKSLDLYESPSSRYMIEAMLFATLSVPVTAKVLKMRESHLQLYADCFFDIRVFESVADKVLYLDRYALLDVSGAEIMRNAMDLDEEQLLFLADQSSAKKVSPKEVIETTQNLFFQMMKLFIKPQFEQLVLEGVNKEQSARFDRLFSLAKDCSNQAMKASELLLKYELDKTSENFLEEFALALKPQPPADLIAPPPDKNNPNEPEIY